ncbi:MAG: MFS transporter, partial [Isosphaeraceae bacterium]
VGHSNHYASWAFFTLLAVRALMGVVSAPMYPASAAAVGRWVAPESRSRTNGLITGGALIGVAASPPLFGALMDLVDWPMAFLLSAAPTFALASIWIAVAPRNSRDRLPRETDTTGWWRLLSHRGLALLTLSYAAVGYFQYLFFYWMTYYFDKVLQLPESASRGYAALPPLAMAVGMPLGGWLGDRLERRLGARKGRALMPMAGMTAGGLLLLCGVFAREPGWIVAWFSLALGAVGTSEGAFWVTAVELGERRGGSSAALLNTGGNAGGMLAPVITPWVGEWFGWGWAVGLGGLICLTGVLLWLGVAPPESKPSKVDLDGSSTLC